MSTEYRAGQKLYKTWSNTISIAEGICTRRNKEDAGAPLSLRGEAGEAGGVVGRHGTDPTYVG